MDVREKLMIGVQRYRDGRYAESAHIAAEILQVDANNFRALNLQGMSLYQQGHTDAGTAIVAKAAELCPEYAAAHNNLGTIHKEKGNLDLALQCLDRAIDLDPDAVDFHLNRATVCFGLGEFEKSLESVARILSQNPEHVDAYCIQADAFHNLDRTQEALASLDRAIELKPNFPEALYKRGISLSTLNRHAEALASYDRAIELKPDYAAALNNRGILLGNLNRHAEAFASYEQALAIKPDNPETHNNRGNALRALARLEEALASYGRALALKPDYPAALYNRGHVLRDLNRNAEAARTYAQLLELDPDFDFARGEMLHAKMLCCDWAGFDAAVSSIEQDLRAGKRSAEPFGYQAISHSAKDLRRCAEIYAAARIPRPQSRLWRGERYDNPGIRVGYLSGEFRSQAISFLTAGLFELHDRKRFEIFAFDNGWDDASETRGRINLAFREIVAVAGLDDIGAAKAIRQRQIDILVDLNGHFGLHRQGVLSHRPCPIQVGYLGLPGTIGTDILDYIVADKHVIPPEDRVHYTERVVYLPDTYWVNDARRVIAESTPTRKEVGLPRTGFVFCCFNNNYKITPEIFGIWMSVLNRVEGSVLWLLEDNADASRNLRREAAQRGIAPERLVFAPRIRVEAHLARHRLADLSLDTLPYNAHTTASDALWAGLPHLTCRGTTFPGRVGASQLNAVGLPELIAESLEEYEERAARLANTPALLAGIRARLAANRTTQPLFDTDRFRRHIESAYLTMWERVQRGDPPVSFAVRPEPA